MQTVVSTVKVTVINQCHVVAHFAQPSAVRQDVVGVEAFMMSCLRPLRQGFKLVMIELYGCSHTLLKPLQRGFSGGVCIQGTDGAPDSHHTFNPLKQV